jgi:hypothetical protein
MTLPRSALTTWARAPTLTTFPTCPVRDHVIRMQPQVAEESRIRAAFRGMIRMPLA